MNRDEHSPPRRRSVKTAAVIAGVAGLAFGVLGAFYMRSEPPPAAEDSAAPAMLRGEVPLRVWPAPRKLADFHFEDEDGSTVRLADHRGKVLLVNLWATWCPPCRREMPALDRLRATLGGPDFEVLAVSIEPGGAAKVRAFYDETGVKALRVYIDGQGEASAAIRSPAIPTSVLVGRDGMEIGRLLGPAEWDSPAAIELIRERIAEAQGR